MKRLLLVLALLLPSFAQAQIIPTLPVTLTNGSLADANQVMSNFNTIVTGVNTNAAKNGANSDITSLSALTTPITPAQGGTNVYIGTGSGTGNAQLVVTPTPTGFTLTSGYTIHYIPSASNTGATTLSVAGTTAKAVLRQTSTGLQPLVGGEIVASQMVVAIYDGTQYEIINSAVTANVQPCTEIDYQGVSVPTGYLLEDGSAKSRTSFAALFSCLAYTAVSATTSSGSASVTVADSTIYQVGWFVGGNNVTCNSTILSKADSTHITISNNASGNGATTLSIGPQQQGDCSTTFNIPGMFGRASVSADTSGVTLTTAACSGRSTIGATCGSTTQTIETTNLPAYTPAGSVSVALQGAYAIGSFTTGTPVTVSAADGINNSGSNNANIGTFTGTPAAGQNKTPFLLQPIGLVTKAIKF